MATKKIVWISFSCSKGVFLMRAFSCQNQMNPYWSLCIQSVIVQQAMFNSGKAFNFHYLDWMIRFESFRPCQQFTIFCFFFQLCNEIPLNLMYFHLQLIFKFLNGLSKKSFDLLSLWIMVVCMLMFCFSVYILLMFGITVYFLV